MLKYYKIPISDQISTTDRHPDSVLRSASSISAPEPAAVPTTDLTSANRSAPPLRAKTTYDVAMCGGRSQFALGTVQCGRRGRVRMAASRAGLARRVGPVRLPRLGRAAGPNGLASRAIRSALASARRRRQNLLPRHDARGPASSGQAEAERPFEGRAPLRADRRVRPAAAGPRGITTPVIERDERPPA